MQELTRLLGGEGMLLLDLALVPSPASSTVLGSSSEVQTALVLASSDRGLVAAELALPGHGQQQPRLVRQVQLDADPAGIEQQVHIAMNGSGAAVVWDPWGASLLLDWGSGRMQPLGGQGLLGVAPAPAPPGAWLLLDSSGLHSLLPATAAGDDAAGDGPPSNAPPITNQLPQLRQPEPQRDFQVYEVLQAACQGQLSMAQRLALLETLE